MALSPKGVDMTRAREDGTGGRRRWLSALLLTAGCGGLTAPALLAVAEPLTLRVSDAAGQPGGEVAVVLRTYASRGVGRGQICLRSSALRVAGDRVAGDRVAPATQGADGAAVTAAGQPLATFLGATVFSSSGDAVVTPTFNQTLQELDLLFTSLTGSINAVDGPLAVLRFQLAADANPGDTFDLQLVPAESSLVDANGLPIDLVLRAGKLDILPPGAPRMVSADGDKFLPGDVAVFGVATSEVFPIASGRVTLEYDTNVVPLPTPGQVRIDPRLGGASFTVSYPQPNRVQVDFISPDGELGQTPGLLVALEVPTSACVADGTNLLLTLVTTPATATELRDGNGQVIPVVLENGNLLFERPGLTDDTFEVADLRYWCGVVF